MRADQSSQQGCALVQQLASRRSFLNLTRCHSDITLIGPMTNRLPILQMHTKRILGLSDPQKGEDMQLHHLTYFSLI